MSRNSTPSSIYQPLGSGKSALYAHIATFGIDLTQSVEYSSSIFVTELCENSHSVNHSNFVEIGAFSVLHSSVYGRFITGRSNTCNPIAE